MAAIPPIETELHVQFQPELVKHVVGYSAKQVYLAGPIGRGGSENNGPWREEVREVLEPKGLIVVEPLEASQYPPLEATQYTPEEATQYTLYDEHITGNVAKVLTQRDRRFSMESDFLLANFLGSTARSIGTCIELGWANASGTTIVTVMEEGDEHRHPIVESVSDYITDDLDRAMDIVASLAADRVEDM